MPAVSMSLACLRLADDAAAVPTVPDVPTAPAVPPVPDLPAFAPLLPAISSCSTVAVSAVDRAESYLGRSKFTMPYWPYPRSPSRPASTFVGHGSACNPRRALTDDRKNAGGRQSVRRVPNTPTMRPRWNLPAAPSWYGPKNHPSMECPCGDPWCGDPWMRAKAPSRMTSLVHEKS